MRHYLLIYFCCRSLSIFSQNKNADTTRNFITESSAIKIAKRHGCYKASAFWKSFHWEHAGAYLDTAKGLWRVGTEKTGYRKRGRADQRPGGSGKMKDKPKKCKHTNGCTAIKAKEIYINARTGRIIKKEREKWIYSNYE